MGDVIGSVTRTLEDHRELEPLGEIMRGIDLFNARATSNHERLLEFINAAKQSSNITQDKTLVIRQIKVSNKLPAFMAGMAILACAMIAGGYYAGFRSGAEIVFARALDSAQSLGELKLTRQGDRMLDRVLGDTRISKSQPARGH